MITLNQHNREKLKDYGLDKVDWEPAGVLCPVCLGVHPAKGKEVEMKRQVGIVLTSHPPKQKVACPKCLKESYMII